MENITIVEDLSSFDKMVREALDKYVIGNRICIE